MYDRVNIDSEINMSADPPWMSAAEASQALGVRRATLYAYVSRGYIRSQPTPGPSRERSYARDDVERLRRRTEERDPDKAAARALQWGMPVLESSIAFIDGKALYYRGHDAAVLSRSRSLEEVASLMWTGRFDASFDTPLPPTAAFDVSVDEDLPFVGRAQAMLIRTSAQDPHAFDLGVGGAARTGWRILNLLAEAASRSRPAGATIDRTLARVWRVGARGEDLLRSALILCADHELNVSSFTARCVASAGSNPYAVVIGGLTALEGTRHGGATARVEALLHSMHRVRPLQKAIAARLRRGESIDGFGHPLYPYGDPRAAALLDLLRDRYATSAELAFVMDFANAASAMLHRKPNIDFALASLARVLHLPAGSPLALFAIGRTIGWIGHGIEQYTTGQLIRPRAKYVGAIPPTSTMR